jgi:rRNA maturation RNase YbeY
VSGVLSLRNHQRAQPVNLPFLRRVTMALLQDCLECEDFDLGIHFVSDAEMTRLNETFLQHQGSTDVITFDYAESRLKGRIYGEIFISTGEARVQSRRFRTTWQSELIRYIVHGLLHLCGYDDRTPTKRRRMKSRENRLLTILAGRFSFAEAS